VRVRTTYRLRALAAAIIAVSLSWAGPGTRALVAAPDALERQVREGKTEQPFVLILARPATESLRVAVRPGRAVPDQPARDLVGVLAPVFHLPLPQTAVAPALPGAPRAVALVPVTSRSSRGPPLG
jgi:hypothetical protein